MSEGREMKAVLLPVELYQKVEERALATGFSSVEEYVELVLQEVVKEEEEASQLTEAEEKEVKKRLKDLGYL